MTGDLELTYGSVCSGIEAASVAWDPLGFKPAWFAEVDAAASAVLAYHFPAVANLGDMTAIPGLLAIGAIDAPDILVGGTPCQAFSVAGRREGLADARGQLTLSYVEIADELDRQRAASGREPCIALWENVPGVLSQDDNAFGCFLAALAGDADPLEPGPRPADGKSDRYWTWKQPKGESAKRHVPKWPVAGVVAGPERTVGWIVRDAQYYGLAQRRRRVFVVASAREGFDPAAILFEFDSVRRDSPPSRETGEGVAGTLDARSTGGGFPGTDGACSGHDVPAAGPGGVAFGGGNCSGPLPPATALNANERFDFDSETFVTQPVTAFSSKDYGADATDDLAPTLRASGHSESHANGGSPPAVAYAIQERALAQNPLSGPDGVGVRSDDCAYTLEARSQVQAVAFVQNSRDEVRLMGGDGQIVGALAADTGAKQQCSIAASQDDAVCVTGSVTHTLKAEGFDASEDGTGRGQPITPAVCFQTRIARNGRGYEEEIAPALNGADAGATSDMRPCVATSMAVRRLMPVECERLQGFPDNWTRIPVRHYSRRTITKTRPEHQWEPDPDGGWWLMAADGPRYKQLGNSMAVPVMRKHGARIKWWLMHRDVIVDLIA